MGEEEDEENLSLENEDMLSIEHSELKAEHSPELNGVGDNIIAATCTIEDNSPVIMSSCSHALNMESDDMNNLGIDKNRIGQQNDVKSVEEEGRMKCKEIKTDMLSKKKRKVKKKK